MVKCGGFMGGDFGWEEGQFLSQLIKSEPPTKPKTLEKVCVVVVEGILVLSFGLSQA